MRGNDGGGREWRLLVGWVTTSMRMRWDDWGGGVRWWRGRFFTALRSVQNDRVREGCSVRDDKCGRGVAIGMALRASPAFALHSVARPLWIPACAGMTFVSGNDGGWRVSGRTTSPRIPCVRFAPRPLRCAKGRGPHSSPLLEEGELDDSWRRGLDGGI